MNKDNPVVADLERIYRETLQRCSPDLLVSRLATDEMPHDVVAIGKCAGPMLEGLAAVSAIESAFVVLPAGYPPPRSRPGSECTVMFGGHPHMSRESFAAGAALLAYVDSHRDITFLISGGGSACVEAPLRPYFTEEDIVATNRRLLQAGIAIAEMNVVRKHLSAIKGGRLAARVHGRCVTLIYSDVGNGDLGSVASGPTVPDHSTVAEAIRSLERVGDCDRIVTALRDESLPSTVSVLSDAMAVVVADNGTLVRTAETLVAESGLQPVLWQGQIETDVATAALDLARRARLLEKDEVLIAGGEPTVVVHGDGRGGRCVELAVRFAMEMAEDDRPSSMTALFGSSDGVDGNSGVAGLFLSLPQAVDRAIAAAALASSDSLSAAVRIGRPIIIPPTGNNLRDLYLVARA